MISSSPKIRTTEQKLKKMLKEEQVILDLELAIKKEQFRRSQKTPRGFYERPIEIKNKPAESPEEHKNGKISDFRNFLLNKIGF
jgi:hypothetical protein